MARVDGNKDDDKNDNICDGCGWQWREILRALTVVDKNRYGGHRQKMEALMATEVVTCNPTTSERGLRRQSRESGGHYFSSIILNTLIAMRAWCFNALIGVRISEFWHRHWQYPLGTTDFGLGVFSNQYHPKSS